MCSDIGRILRSLNNSMTRSCSVTLAGIVLLISNMVFADETCMSPYMAKIVGQKDLSMFGHLERKGWEMNRTSW